MAEPTPIYQLTFRELLAEHLTRLRISNAELARRLGGIDRGNITRWLNGYNLPGAELALQLPDALGLSETEARTLLIAAGYGHLTKRLRLITPQSKETPDKPVEVITVDHDLSNAEVYVNRGIAYYRQGRLIEAIADYNRAIVIAPHYAKAYVDRGIAYYTQGKLDNALSDYNRAITLDSNCAEAYVNRGIVYYRQGKLIEAIADYDKAIVIDSNYAKAYLDRGIAYYNQGKVTEAIADYNKAIALNPRYSDQLGEIGANISATDADKAPSGNRI